MADKRVVVTGMGVLSPIGNTLEAFQKALQAGDSGIRKMPQWDEIDNLRSKLAGIVEGIDEKIIPRKVRRGMGRVAVLAALATKAAIADSGLSNEAVASERCGVSYGSTTGSTATQEAYMHQLFERRSLLGMQSSSYLQFMSHTCAANLAVMFQTMGPIVASSTACTSGSQGVGFAYQQIKLGQAEIMLAGGAEEMHYMDAGIFDIMRATSTAFNDEPERSPRPFDKDRDGLVVGEGAGTLVLEDYEQAKARGARIYAEVVGYATNSDGHHMTAGRAEGLYAVMKSALKDAGISAEAIEHVNAHATATDHGDRAEAEAIHKLFGAGTPVTALKGQLGHTLGACGAIESIATILMMNHGFMAKTRNLEKPDDALPKLDHVINEARQAPFCIGMNNNFAFGGVNTSLIFEKI